MASQRMIKLALVETDKFMGLPPKAQLLYFNLILRADDDGFIGSTKTTLRLIGADENDLELLVRSGYLFVFESGVSVIRHWKLHNHVRPAIYKETYYTEEFSRVYLNDMEIYELRDTVQSDERIDPARYNNASEVNGSVPVRYNNASEVNGSVPVRRNNASEVNGSVPARRNNASEVSAGKLSEGKESKVKCSAGKGSSRESDEGYTHGNTHTTDPFFIDKGGTARDETVMSFAAVDGYYRMTKERLGGLIRAYPGLDVMKTLERIRKYLDSYPPKRRSIAATGSYIELWLSDDAEKRAAPRREQPANSRACNNTEPDDFDGYESSSVIDMLGQMPGFEDIGSK